MNLVMNAVKYTPRGGRIDVSLSHRLDGVTFSVRDTGVGIAATDLPHIFERPDCRFKPYRPVSA